MTERQQDRHGWFGPTQLALAGWVHSPDESTATGTGVVLCPPLGIEGVVTHQTYRALAAVLVDLGLTVVRFDYAGTGDSWDPPPGADHVPEWLVSIRHAVHLLRDAGATRVELVGMRSGALLAATAVTNGLIVDGLVLWDPHVSGHRMLRHEKALLRLNIGGHEPRPRTDGSVAGPGFVYSEPTARHVRQLRIELEALTPQCPAVDLLVRSDVPEDPDLIDSANRVGVVARLVDDQAQVIDVPAPFAKVPQASVRTVATTLAERAGPVAAVPPVAHLRELSRGGADRRGGSQLIERSGLLGSHEAFAVTTEPEGDILGTVLLVPAVLAHHIGSGRSWVELARLCAARGLRVIRLDPTTAGDSPGATGVDGPVDYYDASVEDIIDAVQALGHSQDLALVGLCAGAWSVCRAAAVVDPRAVVLINQWYWTVPAEPLRTSVDPPKGTMNARMGRRLQTRPRLLRLATRSNAALRRLRPKSTVHLQRAIRRGAQGHLLTPLLAAGIEIDMVNCSKEADRLRRFHTTKEVRALESAPGFTEIVNPAWEHSLFTRETVDEVLPLVADRLATRFVSDKGDNGAGASGEPATVPRSERL